MINGALHPIRFQKYILGGEALEKELLKDLARVQENDFTIYNEYGPTEGTVGCIVYKMSKEDILKDREVYIGKQIANTHIYLLDEEMKPVPVGSVGEIYISGRCLAKGYLGNPLLTQEKFIRKSFFKGLPCNV
jgi:surfactin family lipopeptide synthetase A